ncbi:serine/threonine kinase family protein [Plesiocystis pacifica SIR-1]|uniref:Serine/threonine kinase family protein n=1 Tax=Plesiocystis pacifica SIR-1 TaxID=391625 RepID=A6G847_9BACT|nr:serine/threonine protein kinase [Plesiocystis pacifica]EDM78009.1 serine/threonine kinase family protein [Plesiocystis pacifica SIR-1]
MRGRAFAPRRELEPARAQALLGAFEALGGPSARPEAEAVSRFVDARVAVWAEEYEGLCARAAEAPMSETDRRISACLELRSAELDAILGVLSSGEEGSTDGGVSLAHETLTLGPCTDSSFLPLLPEDPELRARFIELRARVAQLAVLQGKVSPAELAGLRAEVELLDHPPLTGAYALVEARYREVQGDEEGYERGLIRAYEAAALGGHEPLALFALGRLVFLMAKQRRFDEAEWVLRQGEILDARCGAANPHESGTWKNGRALMAFLSGDKETAAEVWRQSWERYSKIPGGENLGLGTLGNYATATRHLGRRGEARGLYLRVIELERKLYGDDDPRLFPPYLGLSLVECERDTEASSLWLDEAEGVAKMSSQRALVLANRAELHLGRGAYGQARDAALAATEAYAAIDKRGEQAWVGSGLFEADALAMLGDYPAARARLEQTRAEADATYDGDLPYPELFVLLDATLALEQGKLEAAEAALERGRGMGVDAMDSLSRGGRFDFLAAELARRRGAWAEAEAHARAGLDRGGSVTVNVHVLQPRLQLLLAEVLWARPEASPSAEREGEARALVEGARDQLQLAAPTPGRAALLAEVEAWLGAHG